LRVETGDNALIGGFIVTGTEPKKVIIRAIGPKLSLSDRLPNPTLELRDSSGALLESNDDWMNSPNKQAIIDSTIPQTNELEPAVVATLPANGSGYTAIVAGFGRQHRHWRRRSFTIWMAQSIRDATTVPPSNDADSAIVATLPGNGASFTAIVRGVNDATGIAVVEVYALN
jgi:hypothetical protein